MADEHGQYYIHIMGEKLWEGDEVMSPPQGSVSYLNNQNETLALKKETYLIPNQLTIA